MSTLQAERLQTEPPIAPKRSTPGLPWQFVRVALFLALVTGALELAFAAAGVGEQEYLKPDPNIGFIGIPNKRITWRSEGFSRTSFNEFGMNDVPRKKEKTANKTRVAVLGDSFVEALQVDRTANFCALTEKRLPQYEVLNFGSSAYNLGQVYLRLKHQVTEFNPDVVVVTFSHNSVFRLVPDPKGGFLSARPVFYIDGGHNLLMTKQLQDDWQHSKEAQRIRNTSWLREHSRIWGVVSLAVQDIANTRAATAPTAPSTSDIVLASAPASPSPRAREENQLKATRYYWSLAESLILAIKKECDRSGARLILVRLPATGVVDNPVESAMLAQTARDQHIELLETDPAFKAAGLKGKKLFFSAHLAPQGHAIVADMLAARLKNTKPPDSI